MDAREFYKQKCEAQIHEWEARVAAIEAHTEKLTPQARTDVRPHVEVVHARLEAARARAHDVAAATDESWHDSKQGADQAWSELRAAAAGAYDAMKSTRSER